MQYKYIASVLKALSDETRLKIADMLKEKELCACKILEKFNITQPTLSYHMKVLVSCGIVNARRDGAWMHYSINEDKSKELAEFFSALAASKAQSYGCGCN